jgi:hypothetical protein
VLQERARPPGSRLGFVCAIPIPPLHSIPHTSLYSPFILHCWLANERNAATSCWQGAQLELVGLQRVSAVQEGCRRSQVAVPLPKRIPWPGGHRHRCGKWHGFFKLKCNLGATRALGRQIALSFGREGAAVTIQVEIPRSFKNGQFTVLFFFCFRARLWIN